MNDQSETTPSARRAPYSDMAASRPKRSDFLRQRFGAGWVLARRASRMHDANVVSQKDFDAAVREYHVTYGDNSDDVRAAMHMALKRALFVLESPAVARLVNGAGTVDQVRAAIQAEETRTVW